MIPISEQKLLQRDIDLFFEERKLTEQDIAELMKGLRAIKKPFRRVYNEIANKRDFEFN